MDKYLLVAVVGV